MAGYLPSSCLDSRYLHATRRLVVKELPFTDGSCGTLVVRDVLYEEYEELDSRRRKTVLSLGRRVVKELPFTVKERAVVCRTTREGAAVYGSGGVLLS